MLLLKARQRNAVHNMDPATAQPLPHTAGKDITWLQAVALYWCSDPYAAPQHRHCQRNANEAKQQFRTQMAQERWKRAIAAVMLPNLKEQLGNMKHDHVHDLRSMASSHRIDHQVHQSCVCSLMPQFHSLCYMYQSKLQGQLLWSCLYVASTLSNLV